MDNNTIEEKFNQIFDSKIKPYVSSLENERLSIKKFVQSMLPVNILLFIVVIVMIGGIALNFIPPKISAISIISILVIFTPISIIIQLKIKKLRKRIKEETFPPLLNVFGNLQIGQKDCITLKELKQSGLFPRAAKKKDDDSFVGTYKGLNIKILETLITHVETPNQYSVGVNFNNNNHDSASNKTIVDFRGLLIKIQMNKNFTGHTVVKQKTMDYKEIINNLHEINKTDPDILSNELMALFDKIYNNPITQKIIEAKTFMDKKGIDINPDGISIDFGKNKAPKKLQKVTLEDPEFNDKYNVFSDDQVESRYLLTPTFMERFKNLSKVFLSFGSSCVFENDCITLAISPFVIDSFKAADLTTTQQELFEIIYDYKKDSLLDKKNYLKVFKQLLSIFNLIYYFKLDQKTGI